MAINSGQRSTQQRLLAIAGVSRLATGTPDNPVFHGHVLQLCQPMEVDVMLRTGCLLAVLAAPVPAAPQPNKPLLTTRDGKIVDGNGKPIVFHGLGWCAGQPSLSVCTVTTAAC